MREQFALLNSWSQKRLSSFSAVPLAISNDRRLKQSKWAVFIRVSVLKIRRQSLKVIHLSRSDSVDFELKWIVCFLGFSWALIHCVCLCIYVCLLVHICYMYIFRCMHFSVCYIACCTVSGLGDPPSRTCQLGWKTVHTSSHPCHSCSSIVLAAVVPAFHLMQNTSSSTLLSHACTLPEVIYCWHGDKPGP